MVNPSIKCTFAFTLAGASWTETHYSYGVTSFVNLRPFAIDYANKRAQTLGAYAALTEIRLSDVTNPRDTYLVPPTSFNGLSPFDYPTTQRNQEAVDADQPNSSIQLRIETEALPKTMYLAGVPDDVIGTQPRTTRNLTADFNPNWRASLLSWIGSGPDPAAGTLIGGNWGCLVKAPTGRQVCTAQQAAAPLAAYAAVQAQAPLAGGVGDKVLVTGFRSVNPRQKGLSGVYKILAIQSGNVYVLAGTTAAQAANVKPLPGHVADLSYKVAKYTSCTPLKGTSRKRGNSFGRPAGKSKTLR